MTVTTVRALQINSRLFSSSLTDGHPWSKRRIPFRAMLQHPDIRPSVMFYQETDYEDVVPDLVDFLNAGDSDGGPRGDYACEHRGKVGMLYDEKKWRKLSARSWDMPNGTEDARRLVLTELESRSTGGSFVGWATHLGVHFKGEQAARRGQAKFILDRLAELKFDPARTAIVGAGDINDTPTYPSLGVRSVMRAGGLLDVRTRLAEEDVDGDTLNTHHGYKRTQSEGKWLDEFFTSRPVRLLDAEVVVTDPFRRFPNATDHNGLRLRFSFGTDLTTERTRS